MPRQTKHPETYRGKMDVEIPTFTPVFRTIVEVLNLRRVLSGTISAGSAWVFLYVFTPCRFRLRPVFKEKSTRYPWVNCPARSAVLLPPDIHYQVDTRMAGPRSHHSWMHLDGLHVTPAFHTTGGLFHVTRYLDPDDVLGKRVLEATEATETSKPNPFWTMQVHGRNIINLLATAVPTPESGVWQITKKTAGAPPDPVVARVLSFFEGNLGRRIKLADIARQLHASASTISHRFQKATGEAPMHALIRMRVFRAKGLLLKGLLVSDVAEQLGFHDDVHLALTFKKWEGMSPSQFVRGRVVRS